MTTEAGREGSLSPDHLRGLVPDIGERDVYLCGPPMMMRLLRDQNVGAGERARKYIHVERSPSSYQEVDREEREPEPARHRVVAIPAGGVWAATHATITHTAAATKKPPSGGQEDRKPDRQKATTAAPGPIRGRA